MKHTLPQKEVLVLKWLDGRWDNSLVRSAVGCSDSGLGGRGGQAIGMQRINRPVHPRLQCNRDRESRVDGQQSLREALVRQPAYQSPSTDVSLSTCDQPPTDFKAGPDFFWPGPDF